MREYPGIKGISGTYGDPTMFMSSSLDGSVVVWSLDVIIQIFISLYSGFKWSISFNSPTL